MREFSCLNYHAEYTCEGSIKTEGNGDACFSSIFRSLTNTCNNVYRVVVYKDDHFIKLVRGSNACFLSKIELSNHLRQLQSLYPFKFSIIEETREVDEDISVPCYLVTMHLKDVPELFHKYVLTWLRYTYEFPYNTILLDTYRLKKFPIFRFTSISNLFNIVSNCANVHVGEGHSISESHVHQPLSKKELRERIRKVETLNSIYKSLRLSKNILPETIEGYKPCDLEYWSLDLFEIRKPYYLQMYNKIVSQR